MTMDGTGPTVLVVDDDKSVRFTIRRVLEDDSLLADEASDGAEGLARVLADPGRYRLVITDLRMPGMDGLELLSRLRQLPDPPAVIVITAHGSEKHAVQAMKGGAYDYLKKPFDIDELTSVVRRAVRAVELAAENRRLRGELNLSRSLVFASPAMAQLATLIQRVAARDITVLIRGETGTGKERVAEAIVRASGRALGPFVRFSCAALTGELAEAELFGHVRGAFTGAHRDRSGLFREANGGTLLLDEVGELAPTVQAKLLRVLQESEVRAVGDDRPHRVDVRVLAATHRDLEAMVRAGQFREDLLYRLNVVTLRVPPLRERPEDVAALARYFLDRASERFGSRAARVPAELVPRLSSMPWPGNVRELENAIERLVALSPEDELDLALLPPAEPGTEGDPAAWKLKERVEAYERALIVASIREARGNRSEAARRLGITRVTLYDKLKKYGIADEP